MGHMQSHDAVGAQTVKLQPTIHGKSSKTPRQHTSLKKIAVVKKPDSPHLKTAKLVARVAKRSAVTKNSRAAARKYHTSYIKYDRYDRENINRLLQKAEEASLASREKLERDTITTDDAQKQTPNNEVGTAGQEHRADNQSKLTKGILQGSCEVEVLDPNMVRENAQQLLRIVDENSLAKALLGKKRKRKRRGSNKLHKEI